MADLHAFKLVDLLSLLFPVSGAEEKSKMKQPLGSTDQPLPEILQTDVSFRKNEKFKQINTK